MKQIMNFSKDDMEDYNFPGLCMQWTFSKNMLVQIN
jgi:hypothetical protein